MYLDTQFLLFLATGGLVGVLIALYRFFPERRARILAFTPGLVLLLLGVLLCFLISVPHGSVQALLFLALAAILLADAVAARQGPFRRQIVFGGALAFLGYAWVLIECLRGAPVTPGR